MPTAKTLFITRVKHGLHLKPRLHQGNMLPWCKRGFTGVMTACVPNSYTTSTEYIASAIRPTYSVWLIPLTNSIVSTTSSWYLGLSLSPTLRQLFSGVVISVNLWGPTYSLIFLPFPSPPSLPFSFFPSTSPVIQLGGLWERCKLPHRVRAAKRFLVHWNSKSVHFLHHKLKFFHLCFVTKSSF